MLVPKACPACAGPFLERRFDAGEIACAVIRLRPGSPPPTLPELTTYLLAEGLSKRKLPERLAIVDDFPRTPSGKIVKRTLRDHLR